MVQKLSLEPARFQGQNMAYSVRMLKINDFSKICFFTLCQMLTHKEKTNQNEKKTN